MPVPRHAPRRLPLIQARSAFARVRRERPKVDRAVAILAAALLLAAQLPLAHAVRADVAGTYAAKLTGTHEVPPNGTTGTGSARLVATASDLFYQITATGTGTITG